MYWWDGSGEIFVSHLIKSAFHELYYWDNHDWLNFIWVWRERLILTRTNTYNYLGAALLATWVAGASLGALLLSTHVWILNFASIMCYALTACSATLISGQLGMDDSRSSTVTSRNDPCESSPFQGVSYSVSEVRAISPLMNCLKRDLLTGAVGMVESFFILLEILLASFPLLVLDVFYPTIMRHPLLYKRCGYEYPCHFSTVYFHRSGLVPRNCQYRLGLRRWPFMACPPLTADLPPIISCASDDRRKCGPDHRTGLPGCQSDWYGRPGLLHIPEPLSAIYFHVHIWQRASRFAARIRYIEHITHRNGVRFICAHVLDRDIGRVAGIPSVVHALQRRLTQHFLTLGARLLGKCDGFCRRINDDRYDEAMASTSLSPEWQWKASCDPWVGRTTHAFSPHSSCHRGAPLFWLRHLLRMIFEKRY